MSDNPFEQDAKSLKEAAGRVAPAASFRLRVLIQMMLVELEKERVLQAEKRDKQPHADE